MQPLRSLTFVRIGSANSHKYTPNKKKLRAFKNICNKIDISWKEFGIDYNILDWSEHKYNKHWSYSKRVNYYKGRIPPQELVDYRERQDNLIDDWRDENKELFEVFDNLRSQCRFKRDSYHSPPQLRGLYAFPQYRLETFLTHWDSNKIDTKHCNVGKENESHRMRVKNYAVIKYNKPTIWCHFIAEAKELKVDIRVSKEWVLVSSCDYIKVLELWEKKRLRKRRNDYGLKFGPIKHCYQFGSNDDLEVFLVGV